MSDDPNIDRRGVSDEDGQWVAEHLIGFGSETMGQPLSSSVTFTHTESGRKLKGRILGIGRASDEELKAALQAAKHQAEFEAAGS